MATREGSVLTNQRPRAGPRKAQRPAPALERRSAGRFCTYKQRTTTTVVMVVRGEEGGRGANRRWRLIARHACSFLYRLHPGRDAAKRLE